MTARIGALRFDGLHRQRRKVESVDLDFDVASGFDARHIEQRINQAFQAFAFVVDQAQKAAALSVGCGFACFIGAQHRRKPGNCRERRAHFVGNKRDEIAFGLLDIALLRHVFEDDNLAAVFVIGGK